MELEMVDDNVINLGRGEFFAVDRRAWAKACDLGINAEVSYLVLARGSGADNRTTSWSAEAINDRTALPWRKAKETIAALIKEGLVRQDAGGKRPRYHLLPPKPTTSKPQWIWIPNALVDGVGGATAPIERCRQSGRISDAALRLLVDLYDAQALMEYGGVHWRQIRERFARSQVAERGEYVIWGFERETKEVFMSAPFLQPHIKDKEQKASCKTFFDALKILELTGLVEFVEHIIDCDDAERGEVLHPYAAYLNGEAAEQEIGEAAHAAAESMLAEWRRESIERGSMDHGHLLPAKRHMPDVQMVGILRLRYRARTAATTVWLDNKNWAEWAAKYAILAGEPVGIVANSKK
jgi:hypothetical protein